MKLILACMVASMPLLAIAETTYGTKRELSREYIARVNGAFAPTSARYDRAPRVLNAYEPIYPISRVLSGVTGECIVVYRIGTSGRAENIKVESKDDAKMCDHTIIALRHWEFQPAQKEGQPVAVTVRMPFRFSFR